MASYLPTYLGEQILTICRHVKPDALKTSIFHGQSRPKSPKDLIDHDIVLTTYAVLAADCKDLKILQQISWYRVVLDEGELMNGTDTCGE